MKRFAEISLGILLVLLFSSVAFAQSGTDYKYQALTISSNQTLNGYHYNITTFTVNAGVTLTVGNDGLYIRAERIVVNGTIDATGKGGLGGAAGAADDGYAGGVGGYDASAGIAYGGPVGEDGAPGSAEYNCTINNYWLWCGSPTHGYYCGHGGGSSGGGGSYGTRGCLNTEGSAGGSVSGCTGGAGGSWVYPGEMLVPISSGGTEKDGDLFIGGGGGGGGSAGHSKRYTPPTPAASGGNGGGKIKLEAIFSFVLSNTGYILANGVAGSTTDPPGAPAGAETVGKKCNAVFETDECKNRYGAGGAGAQSSSGSGGGIMIAAPSIDIPNGTHIQANGGYKSAGSWSRGDGGAGRIKIFRDTTNHFSCGTDINCTGAYSLRGCLLYNSAVWKSFFGSNPYGTPVFIPLSNYKLTVTPKDKATGNTLSFIKYKIANQEKTGAGEIYLLPGHSYPVSVDSFQIDPGAGSGTNDEWYFLNWDPIQDPFDVPPPTPALNWDFDGSTLNLNLYFKQIAYFRWRGYADEDWSNKANWAEVDATTGAEYAATNAPGKNDTVFITAGVANILRVNGNQQCDDLTVDAGATVYWNTTDSPAPTLKVNGNLTLESGGDFGNSTANPAGIGLEVVGNVIINDTATLDLTNTTTTISGNINTLGTGNINQDTASSFTVNGQSSTISRESGDFKIGSLIVSKTSGQALTLESNIGAVDTSETATQAVNSVWVSGGELKLNGFQLTADTIAYVSGTGKITVDVDPVNFSTSIFRVIGTTGTTAPISLDTSSNTNPALHIDGGEVHVGPHTGATGINVIADLSGIGLGTRSFLNVENGGTIIIDNGVDGNGWNLAFGLNAKVHMSGNSFVSVDQHLSFMSGAHQIQNTSFRIGTDRLGAETSIGGNFIYGAVSPVATFNSGTEISVYGNVTTTGTWNGDGISLIMKKANGTIDSGETFYSLTTEANTTINSTTRAVPTFSNNVLVQSGTTLTVPAGGTLKMGNDATLASFGTLSVVGNSTDPVTITRGAAGDFYSIEIYGTIEADYAIFEYMNEYGLSIHSTATVDATNNLSNCVFRYSDSSSPYTMLTIDNSQELEIDNTHFLSENATANADEFCVEKSVDTGVVIFTNEAFVDASHADISGDTNDIDNFNRVIWTLKQPYIVDLEVIETPLNSGKGLITFKVDTKGNATTTEYCIWDVVSGNFLDSSNQLAGSSCDWRLMGSLGQQNGIEVETDDSTTINLHIKAENDVPTTPPRTLTIGGPSEPVGKQSPDFIPADGLKDRSSPSVPTNLTIALSGSPKVPGLSWSQSTDPGQAIGAGLDYVVFRGTGGAVGDPGSNPAWGTAPTDYRPINGEWDSFNTGYEYGPTWNTSGSGIWFKNGSTFAQTNVLCGDTNAMVSLTPASKYDLSNGYIMKVDFRKPSGNDGVDIAFIYHDSAARWSIGEPVGAAPVEYYSRVHTGLSGNQYEQPEPYALSIGDWHQATIYVKGNIARGYLDGIEMWSLDVASVPGDGLVDKGFGFRVIDTEMVFDNFLLAPFLYTGATPSTAWSDSVATDNEGPFTPTFIPSMVSASASDAIDITISLPGSPENHPTKQDISSTYFYHVMAVDNNANTSNFLLDTGYEGRDHSMWSTLSTDTSLAFEGTYSGFTSNPSTGFFGGQTINLGALDTNTGSILRFSRYYKLESQSSGALHPAAMTITYPSSSDSENGMSSSTDTTSYDYVETYVQTPYSGAAEQPTSVTLGSRATGATPTFDARFDIGRFDVINATEVSEEFHYSHVRVRLEGSSACTGPWFTLSRPENTSTQDNDSLEPNTARYYKVRSCDKLPGAGDQNCGAYRGGIPCADVSECPASLGLTSCDDFDGVKYCTDSAGCLQGVRRFSLAAVPEKPSLDIAYTDHTDPIDKTTWQANTLNLEWDNPPNPTLAQPINRHGTGFLIYGWKVDNPANCGSTTGIEEKGYLNASNNGLVDLANPADGDVSTYWHTSRNIDISSLDTEYWYCFRVMARNYDSLMTGKVQGWTDSWTGWSPLSDPLQPPAQPQIKAGTFAIKYGQKGAGYGQRGDVKNRAMIIDGTTYQEVSFTIEDGNNQGSISYNDLKEIWVRVSPHASWDENGAWQRGYFKFSLNGSTWEYIESGETPTVPSTEHGNDAVTLLTGTGGSSVTANGDDLDVVVRWTLNVNAGTGTDVGYGSAQDNGVQVYLEDKAGIFSKWVDNRFDSCDEVFHVSYPPDSPLLKSPAHETWTRAASINLAAEGALDHNYINHANDSFDALYSLCCSNPKVGCTPNCPWGLTQNYNCNDLSTSTGDAVLYKTVVKDGITGGVCSGTEVITTTPEWKVMSVSEGRYKMNESGVDISSLEGKYYWCVYAKDEHNYATVASGSNTEEIVEPIQTYQLGIDRTPPSWDANALTVFASDSVGTEIDVTVKDGEWQFRDKPRFVFQKANLNPAAGVAEADAAPIVKYWMILAESTTPVDPYMNSSAKEWEVSVVGDHPQYIDTYTTALGSGEYYWCVRAEDAAGNVTPLSEQMCYYLRIDIEDPLAPIIESPTHPPDPVSGDQVFVYCNNEGDSEAAKPVFEITDPTVANFAAYQAKYPSTCSALDNCKLVHSGMKSYSYTFTKTFGAVPDSDPEDDDTAGMVSGLCDDTCTDTDQPTPPDVFNYYYEPTSESGNIYHTIKYFVTKNGIQQGGTFYFKIHGWSLAGAKTLVGTYRVNVCGCETKSGEPPCKDKSRSATNLPDPVAMNYFGGGEFTLPDGSAGTGHAGGSSQTVQVPPFYIDSEEVTNENYLKCVENEICPGLDETKLGSNTRDNYFYENEFKKHPVINVSWDMAQTYCKWIGKRLPNELEWRFAAAKALDNRPNWNQEMFFNDMLEIGDTVKVLEHHGPELPQGVNLVNMFTNVSEWVSDWWLPADAVNYKDMPKGPQDINTCIDSCLGINSNTGTSNEFANSITATRSLTEDNALAKGIALKNNQATDDCRATCNRKVLRGGSYSQKSIWGDQRVAQTPDHTSAEIGFRCAKDGKTKLEANGFIIEKMDTKLEPVEMIENKEASSVVPEDAVHLRR